jgi:hypothetical protein
MFDIYLRNAKDLLYTLVMSRLFLIFLKFKVSPNKITLLGFLIGLICSYYCYLGEQKKALILWLLNRFIDGFDGKLHIFINSKEFMQEKQTNLPNSEVTLTSSVTSQ